MSRTADIDKNLKIKQSYLLTKSKREKQSCKVYSVKIQQNKLNSTQKEQLKMMFVEAKWLYNHILNLSKSENNSVFNLKYNDITSVIHFNKDKNPITSNLIYLSSQMKQGILDGILSNIRGLANSKKKGNKIGKLNFISEYNSINLKQNNISYKITSKNKIKIQGIKKPLKVNGLKQILSLNNYDLANAKLIIKNNDYYIAITVYVDKEIKEKPLNQIGIDFGCQTTLTLSTGEKINYTIEESEQIKRLKRKISKSKKGSNNRYKLLLKLNKLNYKVNCKKNDVANKICHNLLKSQVIIQDEQLSNWQSHGHGKKITNGILGRIKVKLLSSSNTIVLNKWLPTSKHCHQCGTSVILNQWDREFICPHCGYRCDRDINAAQNMIWFHKNIIGVGRTEFKLVDFKESLLSYYDNNRLIESKKQEVSDSSGHR